MNALKTLTECKSEIATKYGYNINSPYILSNGYPADWADEAALLFAKKMCEKQREICYSNSKITKQYWTDEEPELIDNFHDIVAEYSINKQSILNAPLATEEL